MRASAEVSRRLASGYSLAEGVTGKVTPRVVPYRRPLCFVVVAAALPEARLQLLQLRIPRTELLVREIDERPFDGSHLRVHVL